MAKMSTKDLLDYYEEPEQRDRVLKLYGLRTFLSRCIINDAYRVPDGLHTPLVLTKYGERVNANLRKAGVPFQESRLLCLLEMTGPEPLVDVDRTNIDGLVASISSHIKNRDIIFPFRFGRESYDQFNSLYEQEKNVLSNRETLDFLAQLPQGVFQAEDYVSGPYGILISSACRSIYPNTYLPLQLCSNPSCRLVHHVALSTNYDAPVNEHRKKITKTLDRDGSSIEEWLAFFDEISTRSSKHFEAYGEPYIILIGDALTDDEMRTLLNRLLDTTGAYLRDVASKLGLHGKSSSITRKLNRAQMMQLICIVQNEHLIDSLDTLVAEQQIVVPEGEIRTAVVNYDTAYGPYAMFAELSRLGVRLQTRGESIAPLRLRQMVENMYNLEEQGDRDELLWQLRANSEEPVDRSLQRHLQSEDPRAIVERLALARRSNIIVASEYLRFNDKRASSDKELVDVILWKLGFPVDTFPDLNANLFELHDNIKLRIRQVDSDVSGEFHQELDGLLHRYWNYLEDALCDCVSYTTWALTTDHFSEKKPFAYREEIGSSSLLTLNENGDGSSDSHKVVFSEKSSMYALCRSFGILASKLSEMQDKEESYRRALSFYPEWSKAEQLQVFPFDHTVPFLDLDEEAQSHIIDRLRNTSQSLVSADISELRNATNHPRKSSANLEQLRSALETVREVMSALETDGFCRTTYTLSKYDGDAMNRRRMILSQNRGYKHSLYMPSSYSWLHLPKPTVPQYIMIAARIKDSAEVLRFTRSVNSSYANMYSDYPKRPLGFTRDRHTNYKESSDIK